VAAQHKLLSSAAVADHQEWVRVLQPPGMLCAVCLLNNSKRIATRQMKSDKYDSLSFICL